MTLKICSQIHIGCGGVYPLAATLSAESSSSKQERAKLVALTFSMQGVGYTVVPVLTWILTFIFEEGSDYSWRMILGFGSIPGILLTLLRTVMRKRKRRDVHNSDVSQPNYAIKDQIVFDEVKQELSYDNSEKPTLLQAIRSENELFRKLIGTAGCWFLFDVLFYGNTLFQPVVLEAVFGGAENIRGLAMDQSIVALLALPGYFISVLVMGKQSPRHIQIQGFIFMGILYLIIGTFFYSLSSNRFLLLGLYGATFFFSDYGPNTTVSDSS